MNTLTLYNQIFILISIPTFLWGQSIERQVIASAGSSSSIANISLEWTLGEGFVETLENNSLTLSQGFHQGAISTTSVVYFQKEVHLKFIPNPATQTISLQSTWNQPLDIRISDLYGRIVLKEKGLLNGHAVPIEKLTSGTYFIQISSKRQKIASQILLKQ